MKYIHTFESFLNEADMSRQYDGFVVLDSKNQKSYKFKYSRGNNVPQENDAIDKLVKGIKEPSANFAVHSFIRKGEWDKSEFPEFKK